jgi:hypothetical protein
MSPSDPQAVHRGELPEHAAPHLRIDLAGERARVALLRGALELISRDLGADPTDLGIAIVRMRRLKRAADLALEALAADERNYR